MGLKYSSIKKQIGFKKSNNFKEGADALTHYWQSHGEESSAYFEKEAGQFWLKEAPDFPSYKTVEFDVPFPPVKKPEFTFIDLFAGIGGFRVALQEQMGKCVFSSEWDKYARQTYDANFGEVPFGDITKIKEDSIPYHDILVGGFPCQPFSIAGVSKKNALGKKHGFLDETQGTLFFDIARIIKSKRPKVFLLENVKNLKSHDKGNTFEVIKKTLEKLEYKVFDEVLDARYYVPQHRERIFIVGFCERHFTNPVTFKFPAIPDEEPQFKSIMERKPDIKYTLSDNLWNYLQEYAKKHKAKGNGFGFGVVNPNGVSRTLSARYYKDGSEILISQGKDKNPRRLSPEECKRLMGFPNAFKIKNIGVSDTQLYRQFGNSVAVPVVRAVISSIIEAISLYGKMESKQKERESLLQYESGISVTQVGK